MKNQKISERELNRIVIDTTNRILNEGYSKGDKVQILKTSPRGAKLITDGEKVAWVQGGWVRPDGTLTPSGEKNLIYSNTTFDEWNAQETEKNRWHNLSDEEREAELNAKKQKRIAELNANRTDVSWEMPERDLIDCSPKAYKIRTNRTERMYGREVSVYVYLPKSLTKINRIGNGMISVSLPDWCYKDKKYDIEKLYGSNNVPTQTSSVMPQPQISNDVKPTRRYEIYPDGDEYEVFPGKPIETFRPAFCYADGKLEDDLGKYQQTSDMIRMEPDAASELALGNSVRPGVYKCSFDGKPCTLYVWVHEGSFITGVCCYDDDETSKDYIVRISNGKITKSMMESSRYSFSRRNKIFESDNPNDAKYEAEERFIESKVEPLCEGDNGYIDYSFTNSVYFRFMNESAHYGYSSKKHSRLASRYDLKFNNAIGVIYTIRQYSDAYGPSGDVSREIIDILTSNGYYMLETTSDDEIGTHLKYWFVKELGDPIEKYSDNEDDDYDEYDEYDDYDEYDY